MILWERACPRCLLQNATNLFLGSDHRQKLPASPRPCLPQFLHIRVLLQPLQQRLGRRQLGQKIQIEQLLPTAQARLTL